MSWMLVESGDVEDYDNFIQVLKVYTVFVWVHMNTLFKEELSSEKW